MVSKSQQRPTTIWVKAAFVMMVVAVVLLLPQWAGASTLVFLDWEQDASGNPLLRGQIVSGTTLFHGYGGIDIDVTVSSANNTGIIFDSNIPGPQGVGDPDLGTPNQTCTPPGPGVGIGGEVGQPGENCVALNNLFVIAQNLNDGDGDGLIDIPNDDAGGGVVTVVFSSPVFVDYVDIMDQETTESVIINSYADAAGTVLLTTDNPLGLGNNSFERIVINTVNVMRIDFNFESSGAIATIAFDPQDPTAVTLSSLASSAGGTSNLVWASLLLLALGTLLVWWPKRREQGVS